MNKEIYTYGLLQYRHSQLLGEVLNIGLIVYFPSIKRLEFIYPEKLIRLRFAYPDVPEKTIKSYFRYFEQHVKELNSKPEIFSDYDLSQSLHAFLGSEFLTDDSSTLQFGNFRKSVLYTSNFEHIIHQLYNLYFSVFQIQDNQNKRIDEATLLTKYKHFIREYARQRSDIKENSRFYFDYKIEPSNNSKVSFEVAWKDENTFHLVKPISFDLKRQYTINKKAYQYYGQFIDLQEVAEDKGYLFDVILAKPKNTELFKAYDNAIRLLEKPAKVTLIELSELGAYSKTTAETALFL